jgi:hypothetical protein
VPPSGADTAAVDSDGARSAGASALPDWSTAVEGAQPISTSVAKTANAGKMARRLMAQVCAIKQVRIGKPDNPLWGTDHQGGASNSDPRRSPRRACKGSFAGTSESSAVRQLCRVSRI